MELFNSKDGIANPITQKSINLASPESGVKPIQLDDFFEFLDSKTVQIIKETPMESRSRISNDVAQIEYETEGAQNILNSLR